jgi:hypothetical protein
MNYFRRLRLYWTVIRRLGAVIDVANRRRNYSAVGWITSKYGKFYVRVGQTLSSQGLIRGITLASVEITEKYWRRGFFKIGLKAIEEQARANKFGAVVIENVSNDNLHDYLIRVGYVRDEYQPSVFIKRL